jgi:predicted MPP superfamily phosphohydrolase
LAKGTLATVAVRGNWEWSAGIASETLAAAYANAGVTYLQNDVAPIRVGSARLAIAGLDDTVLGNPDARGVSARVEGDAVIWALHGPGYADLLPRGTPAQLLLAGHTHGGQIRLPFLPGFAPTGSGRFLAGWYETPAAPLYVSRGIGTTTIRARLFCPPELPIVTLVRASAPLG